MIYNKEIDEVYKVFKTFKGGLGEVHYALHKESNQLVCLKTYQKEIGEDLRIRQDFANELFHWVSLPNHLNIVRCYRLVTFKGTPFIEMELVTNKFTSRPDLRSYLLSNKIQPAEIFDFIVQVCTGLESAQTKFRDLAHCDLKPENILITSDKILKITDWGKAFTSETQSIKAIHLHNFELKNISNWYGTPFYMSPEQWQGQEIGPASDVYSLGCILFELFMGRPPYVSNSYKELKETVLTGNIPKIEIQGFQSINDVLMSCLQINSSKRIKNVGELKTSLLDEYKNIFKRKYVMKNAKEIIDEAKFVNMGHAYSALGKYASMLEVANSYISKFGQTSDNLNLKALALFNLKKYEEAIPLHNKSIELDDQNVSALSNRAITLAELKQTDRAINDLKKAISIEPKRPKILYNLAYILQKSGKLEESLTYFDRSIQYDKYFATSIGTRGQVYLQLKLYDKSLADLNRALEIEPYAKNYYRSRGKVHLSLQKFDLALKDLKRAIELDSKYTHAYGDLSNYYDALGKNEEAIETCNKALEFDKSDPIIYTNRGATYLKIGNLASALRDFNSALDIDPTNEDAMLNRGSLFKAKGDSNAALNDWFKVLELNEKSHNAWYLIGIDLLQNKHFEDAIKFLNGAAINGSELAIKTLEEINSIIKGANNR